MIKTRIKTISLCTNEQKSAFYSITGGIAKWTDHICETFGYTVERSEIGDTDEEYGAPTQMGVFRKCV